MTYLKTIQSFDIQIESLLIKSEKAFYYSFVSSPIIIFATAIIYNALNLDSYEVLLIPLLLKFYLVISGYILLSLGIHQGFLMICRELIWAKEIFIRVTRLYGIKKAASLLIEKYARKRVNKSLYHTQNKSPFLTKLTVGKVVSKNIQSEDETKSGKLVKNEEHDLHPAVTTVVKKCMSKNNEGRSNFIHQNDQYNREGRANFSKIIEELEIDHPVYEKMSNKNKYLLVKERLSEHMK